MIRLVLAALLVALGSVGAARAEPRVDTRDGPIVGTTRNGIDWYLGIPYAAPPLGALRWRAPQPVQPWAAPLAAKAYGAWCMQVAAPGFSLPSQSEDCLTLNVAAPHGAARRPVMVWIHGGGMRQGRANDYDPSLLVERGKVVFVSFNYRLNVMGFLAHRAFVGQGGGSANFGLLDQQAVLRWVHANIARFGGNPANVTLIGESSGGANVFAHLVSPGSKPLFARAIIESGSLWYGDFARFYNGLPREEAAETADEVASKLGCAGDVAACLRTAPIERLMAVIKTIPTYAFGVVVDGTTIPRPLRDAIAAGSFAHVPIINGSNADEWTWVEGLEEAAEGHPLTQGELPAHLAETFGPFAAQVVPRYPAAAHGGSVGLASAAAVTDGLFVCPMLALDRALARQTRVYGYEFDDRAAPNPFRPASFAYGAAHTLEMRYLFKDYHGALGAAKPMSADQHVLSDRMVAYWTNFARTGNPNAAALPHWPAITAGDDRYLSLRTPAPRLVAASAIGGPRQCATFWRATEGRVSQATKGDERPVRR